MFDLLLVDFLFGPFEGGGVLIPASDKGFDRLDQHFDTGKAGSLQCAATQNAKPAFHPIEPMLAEGVSENEILQDYPYLQQEDIRVCLVYAARATDHAVLTAA